MHQFALVCSSGAFVEEQSMPIEKKSPAQMTDEELIEAYEASRAEAGADPRNEAVVAEIARRNLDV